jgi:peptidoglycan hydrolase-like protein with peptidoglycan-binding domain
VAAGAGDSGPTAGRATTNDAASMVLSRGRIETAQWGLRRRGIAVDADGNLDPSTQQALAQFQRENRLPVTGLPDAATMRALTAR